MNVMIIGGTSGIGLALARHYLARQARVAVCGRDLGRLDPTLREQFTAYEFDIGERDQVTAAIGDFAQGGLDLLVVCAGQYAGAPALAADPELGLRMAATNVSGLVYAFDAAAQHMKSARTGQLVAIASVAGLLREYPGGSLYSTNKRTVIALGDLYRKTLQPLGIDVSTVVPGYVDTAKLRELSGGDARGKPFLMSEEEAVERIARAIAMRAPVTVFPWQLHWMIRVFNAMPMGLRRLRQK
jgi:NAD(P)-dependent dehydrogenase (short-subunit alcohol dehydrogenase family)